MLHPVPDSSLRRRLMRIVVIQRKLVRALCALPAGSTVDQEWLSSTAWPRVDADWIRRFWENENGRRQAWLNTIAAANASAKRELNEIMDEQHRFKKLYCIPILYLMQIAAKLIARIGKNNLKIKVLIKTKEKLTIHLL